MVTAIAEMDGFSLKIYKIYVKGVAERVRVLQAKLLILKGIGILRPGQRYIDYITKFLSYTKITHFFHRLPQF